MSSGAALAGYVQAGGASSRFGSDKALVELDGKPVLLRVTALVASITGSASVVAPAGRYEGLGVNVVPDRWPGAGPLGGIVTALLHTAETDPACPWNLIVGCDLPFLTVEWLAFLADCAQRSAAHVLLPLSSEGPEPLCACYRTSAAPALQAALAAGERKIQRAMATLAVETLDESRWKRFDSAGRLFLNMNTPADLQRIRTPGEEGKS